MLSALRYVRDDPRGEQLADARALVTVEADLRPLLLEASHPVVGGAVTGWVESGLAARIVRGHKMRTLGGLLDECAAALQFPLFFGENRDAFDECVAELEGLPPGKGYVIAIVEPEQVLMDEAPRVLRWLVHSLSSAAQEWAQPIELHESWDRPAVPFHVVLAGERAQLADAARRWVAAGADPVPFDLRG